MPEIKLTEWEDALCAVIRALHPGVVIQSTEEKRALDSVTRVLQYVAMNQLGLRELKVWSPVSYRQISVEDPSKITELAPLDFFSAVAEFKKKTLDADENRAVLVLADAGHLLNTPNNLRLVRETLWAIRGSRCVLVFLGLPFTIPPSIAPDLNIQTFELPNVKQLETVLVPSVHWYKKLPAFKNLNIDESVVPRFARACAGLTEIEARGLLGLSVSRFSAFDHRAVELALQEKAQIVKRSNVVEYKTCKGGLDSVGGLENVKAWIREQDDVFTNYDAARAGGLQLAKGLLLTGIPGTGKSLLAEMLAAHWSLPLLLLDVGSLFGGIVGQSEENVNAFITLAKACAPCVVHIDEIEKALGGGGGELDGGTTARVKGKLLTWLQNKPADVFVVATANDVTKFESSPELIRAGRFDLVSFVDLPDKKARLEILAIHYAKACAYAKAGSVQSTLQEKISADVLLPVADATRGYSGAELEAIVKRALRFGFAAKVNQPTAEHFVEAARRTKPLAVTMAEQIATLRNWCKEGRAVPAGATIEDDASDTAAFVMDGVPQLLLPAKGN
ncbi:MAG: AAA family ATPase [Acidipila sp.]|nr:AAA family ATPase [Acidipila sp.]